MKPEEFEEFIKRNPDEARRLISKAFVPRELLAVGNRSYVNAYKYPESRFDPQDLCSDGHHCPPNPDMLQPLSDPGKLFTDKYVVPPSSLIFQWAGRNYDKKWWGEVAGGSTDGIATIQSAINVFSGSSGMIYTKKGIYTGSQQLIIPKRTTIKIIGEGMPTIFPDVTTTPPTDGTIIYRNTGGVGGTILSVEDDPNLRVQPAGPFVHQSGMLILEDIGFEIDTVAAATVAVNLTHCRQPILRNVAIFPNVPNISGINYGVLPMTAIGISKDQGMSNNVIYDNGMVTGFGIGMHFSADHIYGRSNFIYRCLYGISLNFITTGLTATGDAGVLFEQTAILQVGTGIITKTGYRIVVGTGVLQALHGGFIPTFVQTSFESISICEVNNYDGTSIHLIRFIGSLTQIRFNNPARPPNYFFNAPAVPASGISYTTIYPFDIEVFISGGTVSDILINGFSTGLTVGRFVLKPGDYIAIIYTVVPTWKFRALLN